MIAAEHAIATEDSEAWLTEITNGDNEIWEVTLDHHYLDPRKWHFEIGFAPRYASPQAWKRNN